MSRKRLVNPDGDQGVWQTKEYRDLFFAPSSPDISDGRKYLTDEQYIAYLVRGIEGKILTLIESSTDDREKRESMKNLATQLIWSAMSEARMLELERVED